MEDAEPFIEWLRGRGTPEQHLAAHRHYAAELAKHPSLSAALRAHEEAGAPPSRLANLRQTAARIAEFEEARFAPPAAASPAAIAAPALAVEPPKPREPRQTSGRLHVSTPRKGCDCKKHYDVYLDNDFGSLARMLGGGIGIGTIVLVRFVGVLGALAIALGLAGLGGVGTILTVCIRCEGCRRRVLDLDDDERATLRKARALVTVVTIGLLVGAAICAFVWWTLVNEPRPRHHDPL